MGKYDLNAFDLGMVGDARQDCFVYFGNQPPRMHNTMTILRRMCYTHKN